MNTLPKILLTISVVLCALALGALAWLALQTTEVKDVRHSEAATFPEVRAAKKSSATADQTVAAAESGDDGLTEKLSALSAAEGVVPGELLLSFKSREALNAFLLRAGAEGIEVRHSDSRLLTARVKYKDPAKMAAELRKNAKDYKNIGANYYVWVPGSPEKPEKDSANAGGSAPFDSSALDAIGATGDRTRWGAGVKVAVLDTGVTDHVTLKGLKITHTDLIKDGQPFNGHGTAMTSLIAGRDERNGGVAPASEILDIRVADSTGRGDVASVAQGIMQAVDQGARLINISLGTTADASVLREAVAYARGRGVVVVAAAGNEQQSQLAYPAAYDGVISVAAVDANGTQAYFSNSGEGLFISAPGVGIVSGYSDNKMVIGNGTSQAAAITSGAVAALLSRNYASSSIPQILTNNVVRVQAPVTQVGAGILHLP
jgi:thermitase